MQKSLKFKSKPHKKFYWVLLVFGLSVFVIGLVFGNIELAHKRSALENNLRDLKNKLEVASKTANQPAIESSPDYLEKMAREQLNLMKPGENVVAFPEKLEEEVDKTEGLLQKIKDKLK
ncbi:MAG: septum formation initiator family protein [Candidatus Gribaldobacteria bacterium]|nr:septum formation initiator family protein [Candidatus Gribaldobacteria bacterium]